MANVPLLEIQRPSGVRDKSWSPLAMNHETRTVKEPAVADDDDDPEHGVSNRDDRH